jgi:hypothetical protein
MFKRGVPVLVLVLVRVFFPIHSPVETFVSEPYADHCAVKSPAHEAQSKMSLIDPGAVSALGSLEIFELLGDGFRRIGI